MIFLCDQYPKIREVFNAFTFRIPFENFKWDLTIINGKLEFTRIISSFNVLKNYFDSYQLNMTTSPK